MTIPFETLRLTNSCPFELWVTGQARDGLATTQGRLAPGESRTFTGREDFIPLKAITPGIVDSQRIEVNRSRTSLDELDRTWLELSQKLRERPGGGYEFQGPVALNFATQTHVGDVGMAVGLLTASGDGIVDRPPSQSDPAAFSRAIFQGTVSGCLAATQGQPQTAVAHTTEGGFRVCAPICPGQPDVPLWTFGSQSCEGCVLRNRYVEEPWGGYWTADDQDFNAFAKYGSDSSCAWRGGRWVSAPRTVTTRQNYVDSGGGDRHREFDPKRTVPYRDGSHGLPADWSPNFECWDTMGTGPEGFPVSATAEEWKLLSALDVEFCPTPVVCERPT